MVTPAVSPSVNQPPPTFGKQKTATVSVSEAQRMRQDMPTPQMATGTPLIPTHNNPLTHHMAGPMYPQPQVVSRLITIGITGQDIWYELYCGYIRIAPALHYTTAIVR